MESIKNLDNVSEKLKLTVRLFNIIIANSILEEIEKQNNPKNFQKDIDLIKDFLEKWDFTYSFQDLEMKFWKITFFDKLKNEYEVEDYIITIKDINNDDIIIEDLYFWVDKSYNKNFSIKNKKTNQEFYVWFYWTYSFWTETPRINSLLLYTENWFVNWYEFLSLEDKNVSNNIKEEIKEILNLYHYETKIKYKKEKIFDCLFDVERVIDKKLNRQFEDLEDEIKDIEFNIKHKKYVEPLIILQEIFNEYWDFSYYWINKWQYDIKTFNKIFLDDKVEYIYSLKNNKTNKTHFIKVIGNYSSYDWEELHTIKYLEVKTKQKKSLVLNNLKENILLLED